MIRVNQVMTPLWAFVAAMSLMGGEARGAAIFNSLASLDLDLIAIFEITSDFQGIALTEVPTNDLIVQADAFLDEVNSGTENGSANTIGSNVSFASPVEFVDPTTDNHTIKLESTAQGSTFQPPDSTANASAESNGQISMQNLGTNGSTYILAFTVERIFNVNATESQPFNDSALSEYDMVLEQQSLGTIFDVSGAVFSDGDTSDFDSHSMIVAVTLAPGDTDVLTLHARASGQASSLIPEPASAAVLSVIGMALLGRRRSAA